VEGYLPGNRPGHERGPDLNRFTWERKRRAWLRQIQIVCPSRWLAAEARSSALMRDWPIHVIPYPIDCDLWAPVDQKYARNLLGLPQGIPLILFGALSGTADPRKGAVHLRKALQLLSERPFERRLKPEIIVFGAEESADSFSYPFKVRYTGVINDDTALALIYSSADVMIVPSLQEAFGQTASEAHACGTPVVAFDVGGLSDIVQPYTTGMLATPFDPASLASCIDWVISDPVRLNALSHAARQRAIREWHPRRIATLYSNLYRDVLSASSFVPEQAQ
jgi:glycosyltransferase involved in cell wall biosynthesis